MTDSIHLRPLNTEELEAYIRLRQESLVDAPLSFGASPESDRLSDPEFLRSILSDPENQIVLVAERGGQLLGSTSCVRSRGLKRGHRADVYATYVTAKARGAGLGRALMVELLARIRAWGVDRIDLSVTDAAPEAHRLYSSLGFVEWGHDPDSLRWEGRSAVEHHLTLRLNQPHN